MSDPLSDLPWLRQEQAGIDAMDRNVRPYFYIASGRYGNRKVFLLSDCCPHCNTISVVKDCSGNVSGLLNTDIPVDAISDIELIYGGNECSF